MVTSMTSFAEDMESSTVMTSFVIHPSAVAPSMINSEIYSVTNFQTDSIASKMMGSIIARGILKRYGVGWYKYSHFTDGYNFS
jgi:hypothetical protein